MMCQQVRTKVNALSEAFHRRSDERVTSTTAHKLAAGTFALQVWSHARFTQLCSSAVVLHCLAHALVQAEKLLVTEHDARRTDRPVCMFNGGRASTVCEQRTYAVTQNDVAAA